SRSGLSRAGARALTGSPIIWEASSERGTCYADRLLSVARRQRTVVRTGRRADPVRLVRRDARRPSAPLLSQTGIGGVLEFFGGLAIMLGLLTRPVAFVLSGMMAVAYWQFHAPNGGWPIQNQGMPAVLFCFIFLFMAARGGGDWSLDALL